MIRLTSITKKYQVAQTEIEVLHNIHLHVQKDEFCAIMGPSGSGKTTLMNIIGCLAQPSGGEYYLNDEKISNFNKKELAYTRNQSIGFVFQHFQLLPRLNALRNVELPLIYAGKPKKEREEKSLEALRKVGLSDRILHLPNELSGGQKQRVAIARAIVNNPSVILADEPTGALDTNTSQQIMELFNRLNSDGTTIVVVTHDPEVASFAERTVLMRDGKIIDDDLQHKGSGVVFNEYD